MPRTQDEDARWLNSQIRPESRRAPQPIGEILSKLLARRGYANQQTACEWMDIWRQAAGELSRGTRPGKFLHGVLEIIVDNSTTLQELTFQKKQLLATMSRLAPQFKLKDVRFKVGQVS